MFTLLKETFFKLQSFENIVAKEEIAPAGAIPSFVTMFSNCCSRRKNEYIWGKGLMLRCDLKPNKTKQLNKQQII